jgi:hypothetical protein
MVKWLEKKPTFSKGKRCAMVPENSYKLISLLATCRKGKQHGDEGGEKEKEGWVVSVFPSFI